ncbi:diguanylate cyclase [Rheinheimera sp.]|uniref:diguanylate cyclase domain-containing protein n=1 Tax=Rheinheimera sp. TaxID=1869214 RepID=UPI00307E2BA5
MPLRQFHSLSQLIDELLEAVCVVDKHGVFVYLSPGAQRVFGYKPAEMRGRNMLEFMHPDDKDRTLLAVNDIMAGQVKTEFENRYIRKDGSVVHLQWSARWSEQEQVRVAVARDITSHKQVLQQLQHLAFYDCLTGLPNRALLMDRLQQGLARCRRENRVLALCFVDLNKFKQINDQYGHAAGDAALCALATALKTALRDTDTVARLGGDEFVVLMDCQNAAEVAPVLEKLTQACQLTFLWQQQSLQLEASIGVALYPQHAVDADSLLCLADQAMFRAKLQWPHLCFAGAVSTDLSEK